MTMQQAEQLGVSKRQPGFHAPKPLGLIENQQLEAQQQLEDKSEKSFLCTLHGIPALRCWSQGHSLGRTVLCGISTTS